MITLLYEPHNKAITLDESMITSDPIDMNVGGEYVIQFTYEGETFEYTILVSEGVLDYIEIASLPAKPFIRIAKALRT